MNLLSEIVLICGTLSNNNNKVKSQLFMLIQYLLKSKYMKKEMATHSSVLAWRIPGMEEPGGLPSVGSHRVRHDWSNLAAASISLSAFYMHCFFGSSHESYRMGDWYPLSTKKGYTTWELWVKFYLGHNEDCSPGAASQIALRDCSKATVRESQYIGFGEGGVQCHEALILQKVFVSHEDLMSL